MIVNGLYYCIITVPQDYQKSDFSSYV